MLYLVFEKICIDCFVHLCTNNEIVVYILLAADFFIDLIAFKELNVY